MDKLINNKPKKLRILLQGDGYKIMPIIRFVSICKDTKIVCLLVGGKCPSCGSNHLRKTCNVNFCSDF